MDRVTYHKLTMLGLLCASARSSGHLGEAIHRRSRNATGTAATGAGVF